MINFGANYTGIDKERYDAGNKFYSQNPYLQGIGLDKPSITFNSSQNNLGIPSQYPYPYPPIIPQGDGDGGGKDPFRPTGNPKFDYEFDALGDLYNKDNVALTDEERDTLNAQKNKDRLAMAGKLGLFALNPMGYLMGKAGKAAFGWVKDKFTGGGDGGSGGTGNKNKTTIDYYSPGGGYEGSDEQDRDNEGHSNASSTGTMSASDFSDDTEGTPFEYGGRVGYNGGGLTGYEIFKLKELGYNTKGGTVLKPFGGLNVLRDILKVNSYAYGGRAGYKDGYSVQDDMTDYATNVGKEASPGGGFKDSGGDGGGNPPVNNINIPKNTSNLNFNLVKDINPAFSYANKFGTLGGVLDATRTIQEEEPAGYLGYVSPLSNFGIGVDTDLGLVSNANLGNLNIGYTGQDGFNANYMGGFDGDAGRFGANYNKDGLEARITYNKKFNNGGIVGLYR